MKFQYFHMNQLQTGEFRLYVDDAHNRMLVVNGKEIGVGRFLGILSEYVRGAEITDLPGAQAVSLASVESLMTPAELPAQNFPAVLSITLFGGIEVIVVTPRLYSVDVSE